MRVVIEGHDLPGAEFVSDGVPLRNVHVAIQVEMHMASAAIGLLALTAAVTLRERQRAGTPEVSSATAVLRTPLG